MSQTPTLNGQIIGQAERATRAVLDGLLDDSGTTFLEWVGLNLLAASGGAGDKRDVQTQMVNGLREPEARVRDALDSLERQALVRGAADDQVELTAAGQARFRAIRLGIDRITARLYADISDDDLATAARVLTVVTEHANAALAG